MIQIELPLLLAIVGALGFCLGLVAGPAIDALFSPLRSSAAYEPDTIYPAPTPFTQTEITYTSEPPKPKKQKKVKR